MARSEIQTHSATGQRGYLCVDAYISDLLPSCALSSAFDLKLIDQLLAKGGITRGELLGRLAGTGNGFDLLFRLLSDNGVIEAQGDGYRLTPEFTAALQYRDLLEAKLDFAHCAASDVATLFSLLLVDPAEFMKRAAMFRLFNYGAAQTVSDENLSHTARWMKITTLLTRYEAGACFELNDISRHSRMLDVGGNSGEFVLQACRVAPELQATVFDLPAVCAVGREHVSQAAESDRITFQAGNALIDPLPEGYDLITFKSMLHDWPDSEAGVLLRRACAALPPGGKLLIFERGMLDVSRAPIPYSMLPILLFAHTLRGPELYLRYLAEAGMTEITLQWLELEMPFFIITAVKGQAKATWC